MEPFIIVLLVGLVLMAGFIVRLVSEVRRTTETGIQNTQQTLQTQVNALDQRLTQSLTAVQQGITQSLSGSSQTITAVTERLAGIDAAAKRILDEVGPGITALQEVLRPPTLRGGFGETLLEQLLGNVLASAHYEMQYTFRNGQKVDAVIRLPDGLVPVDSKFPLDGFKRVLAAPSEEERTRERRAFLRAVRGHVDSVSKYIMPDEGTLPFALMYIPSESVYYEVMVREESSSTGEGLTEYCHQKSVFAVSPNTFYALLQAVAKGLRGLQVAEQAREIINHLAQLQTDFQRVRKDFATLGEHLRHAIDRYDDVDRRMERFEDHLARPLEAPEIPQLPVADKGHQ